jgi:osmotically-inducible protein OsmY
MARTLALAWAILVGCSLAAGCGRHNDAKSNVEKALDQANIGNVSVDVDRNVVHLKGTVGTMAERTRAEEVASAAVGTTGRVSNELAVIGTDRAQGPGDEILDALDRAVDRDPVLKERDINFEVRDGTVRITGEVRNADEKRRAGTIAKETGGVTVVSNELTIRPEP